MFELIKIVGMSAVLSAGLVTASEMQPPTAAEPIAGKVYSDRVPEGEPMRVSRAAYTSGQRDEDGGAARPPRRQGRCVRPPPPGRVRGPGLAPPRAGMSRRFRRVGAQGRAHGHGRAARGRQYFAPGAHPGHRSSAALSGRTGRRAGSAGYPKESQSRTNQLHLLGVMVKSSAIRQKLHQERSHALSRRQSA